MRSLGRVNHFPVNAGNIRLVFLVKINDGLHIHISDNIAVRHYNVFRVALADKFQRARQSLQSAAVHSRVLTSIRRENMQTARLSRKIPFRTHSEMIHQRIIILLCNYTDLSNTRINHSRKREINQTIFSAERNTCHCSRLGEFRERLLVHIGEDQTQYISHTCHIKQSSYLIYPLIS